MGTYEYFSVNPVSYHEMRRGFILGLGEEQWKLTIAHVFPEILNQNKKLRMLASQNIDGLDHKVMSDKRKLFNPHGLMSTLIAERPDGRHTVLTTEVDSPIYQKYKDLVRENTKDIYEDQGPRTGKSSHMWPAPKESTPITLAMFGDLLSRPEHGDLKDLKALEETGRYCVKPGSVLFDRYLWSTTADGAPYDIFTDAVRNCDAVLVMGTSLSGLTIDNVAHQTRAPRLVFDMSTAPVQSLRRSRWDPTKDAFLQGKLDETMLDVLLRLGWFEQILNYKAMLCRGSLETLKAYAKLHGLVPERVAEIDAAFAAECEREKKFYND